MKTAVITGGAGQDGILMGRLLRRGGLRVISVVRKLSPHIPKNDPLWIEITSCVTYPDLAETLLKYYSPDYFFNFAAVTDPFGSWDEQIKTFEVNFFPVVSQLEAILKFKPDCRYLNAGSSTQFNGQESVDYLSFTPDSPYALAKCAAHEMVRMYKDKGLFAIHPILFNHESQYRKPHFLSARVVNHIKKYQADPYIGPLEVGNIDSIRDWSGAEEIVEGMWRALNHGEPQEWQLGRGKGHSVAEFIKEAFAAIGEDCDWSIDRLVREDWKILVNSTDERKRDEKISPIADPTLAREQLNWWVREDLGSMIKGIIYGE